MDVFPVDFGESSFVLGHSSAQLEWGFICLISKVSLPAHVVLELRYKRVGGQ